jgi:hypothetical protein
VTLEGVGSLGEQVLWLVIMTFEFLFGPRVWWSRTDRYGDHRGSPATELARRLVVGDTAAPEWFRGKPEREWSLGAARRARSAPQRPSP